LNYPKLLSSRFNSEEVLGDNLKDKYLFSLNFLLSAWIFLFGFGSLLINYHN